MKRKYLFIFVIGVLLIVYFSAVLTIENEYKSNILYKKKLIYNCSENIGEYCKNANVECIDFCNSVTPDMPERKDAIYVFGNYLNSSFMIWFPYFAILLVGCVATWNFIVNLKTGNIKNILMRSEYKKYIRKEWFNSLKCVFIIPVFFLMLFVTAIILSNGIDKENLFVNLQFWFNINENQDIVMWIICSFLSIIFQSILWINIFYLSAKKSKNILLTVITSYLIYIGLWLCSEVVLSKFILTIMMGMEESKTWFVEFGEIWTGSYNSFGMVLFEFSLAFISTYLVYRSYKNKEEVLILNDN